MRVVVLGGSGNFGARICRALRNDEAIELLSASRRGRAEDAGVQSVSLDAWGVGFPEALAALAPGLVAEGHVGVTAIHHQTATSGALTGAGVQWPLSGAAGSTYECRHLARFLSLYHARL